MQTGGLGTEPFDVAVSQLGVMFFDEPTGGVRRPSGPDCVTGGRLVFVCWQGVEQNPWHTGHGAAVHSSRRPPFPGRARAPWVRSALGDDEYVRDVLGGSGIQSASRAPSSRSRSERRRAQWSTARCSGSWVWRPSVWTRPRTAIERHLERFAVGADEYEYPLAFRVYEADKG